MATKQVILNLNPKQELALTIPTERLLLTGGVRSGKTTSALMKVREIALRMPGSQILIVRKTLKEIRDDLWKSLYNPTDGLLANSKFYGKLNKSNYEHNFPNGSKLLYRQADDPKKLLGLDLSCVYFEQAENIEKAYFDNALTRLTHWGDIKNPNSRGYRYIQKYGSGEYAKSIAKRPAHFFIMSCNPDTGSWIYDDIIRTCKDYTPFTPHIKHEDLGWDIINFETEDNAQLPDVKKYIEEIKLTTSDTYFRRMIKGEWVGSEGMIFSHFNNASHIISDFTYDANRYEIIVAIDPGSAWYTGVIFGAFDKKTNTYIVFDELKVRDTLIPEIAELIKNKLSLEYKISIKDVEFIIDSAANAQESNGVSKADQYRKCGIYVNNANKILDGALERINGLFKTKSIKIVGSCTYLLNDIKSYHYNEDGKPNKRTGSQAFDLCLTGDSLIEMNEGLKQIKDIKIGDIVKTSNGYQKVYNSGMTNLNAPIYELLTSSGKKLKGTGKHPIYSNGNKINMDSLRYFDIIDISFSKDNISWLKQQYTKVLNIQEILKKDLNIIGMQVNSYTERSGKSLMEKFQKVMRYTILTLMNKTTPSQILNVSQEKIIDLNTEEGVQINLDNTLNQLDHSQNIGIKAKMVWSGTKNMVRKCLVILFPKISYAINVTKNIHLNKNGVNSALTIVNQHGEESRVLILKQEFVKFVQKISKLINILKQKHAPEYVVEIKEVGHAPVYNISVEVDHNYYANGILVSNCDAFRYFINKYAYGSTSYKPPVKIEKDSQKRTQKYINDVFSQIGLPEQKDTDPWGL